LWQVFHILTQLVPYTFVSINQRNNEARAHIPHCNVGPGFIIPSIYEYKRIYGTAVPLKYVELATKYPWIYHIRIFIAVYVYAVLQRCCASCGTTMSVVELINSCRRHHSVPHGQSSPSRNSRYVHIALANAASLSCGRQHCASELRDKIAGLTSH